jgi:hypothetical protein
VRIQFQHEEGCVSPVPLEVIDHAGLPLHAGGRVPLCFMR